MLESRRDIQDTNTGRQSGFFAFFSQVIVKEAKNSSHVTTASVSLKLIDMNDNNPLFEKNSYTFYINENSINRTKVGHIMVSNLQHVYRHSIVYCMVPTSSGNHGKPGKALKSSMHGKSWNLKNPE